MLIDPGELAVMLLLAGLAIFITWESFQGEKLTQQARSSAPGQTATEQGLLIGAGVLAVMGLLVLLETSQEPTIGRHAFIWNFLHDAWGKTGIAILLWLAALAMLHVWRRRRKARRNTG
jgi:hypothetical protein